MKRPLNARPTCVMTILAARAAGEKLRTRLMVTGTMIVNSNGAGDVQINIRSKFFSATISLSLLQEPTKRAVLMQINSEFESKNRSVGIKRPCYPRVRNRNLWGG